MATCKQKTPTMTRPQSDHQAPGVTLALLGPFELRRDGQSQVQALDRKTRAILAYLAATTQAQSRHSLCAIFCQNAADPAGTLRWHLSRIRRHTDPRSLVAGRETVALDGSVAWVDCRHFQDRLDGDLQALDMDALATALSLYRGEFLTGLSLGDAPEFELWLLGERARYQQLYIRGMATLIDRLIAAGHYEQAIQRAGQLVQIDPLFEEAHLRLVWLYARTGQRRAAVEQFERCRELLRQELAVEPSPALLRLRQQIERHEAGPSALPWLAGPIESAPQQATTATTPFVGRSIELAALAQAWQSARKEGSALALIAAEAGGGKTRLVREWAQRTPGVQLLMSQGYESTRTLPYRPWIELLQSRLAQPDAPDLGQLAPYWREQLARLLPELAARGRPGQVDPPAGRQEHLFAAIAEVLLQRRPLQAAGDGEGRGLFLDDLQWFDEASLRMFHFMARRLRLQRPATPVLLLGAFRTEECEDNAALAALLRDLPRSVPILRLDLAPLTAREVSALIEQLWPDLPPGYRVPHIRNTLLHETGGNPLFVSELVHELAQAGTVPAPLPLPLPLPLPPSLLALIERRLAQLEPGERQVLEALAVLERPVTLDQARQASGRGEDETATALEQGLRWRLLAAGGTGPPRFDYQHDLMRQAVLAQLSPVRRQILHRRAALTLERSASPPAVLTYHWRMAGDRQKEGHYAALAGAAAAASYANDEAVLYLRRALDLAQDPARRVELMLRLAEVWRLTGQWPAGEAILQEALAVSADNEALQARCRVCLGVLKIDRGDYAAASPLLLAALGAARVALEPAARADALGGLAAVAISQGRFSEARTYAERQYNLAREQGDLRRMSQARGALGIAYTHLEDFTRAEECLHEQRRMAAELGDKVQLTRALRNLAGLYQGKLFDYQRTWDCYEQLLALCAEIGDLPGLAIALGNLTLVYLNLGQTTPAIACATKHLQISLELESWIDISLALAHLGQAALLEERDAEAVPLYDRALAAVRPAGPPFFFGMNLIYAAELYLRQGHNETGRQVAAEALRLAHEAGTLGQVELPARLLLLQAGLALAQIDRAAAVHEAEGLLAAWQDAHGQAAIHYHLAHWEPDPAAAREHAAAAARFYLDLYRRSKLVDYRRRYEELSGVSLPPPPPLPPPPGDHVQAPGLGALLAQVDELMAK